MRSRECKLRALFEQPVFGRRSTGGLFEKRRVDIGTPLKLYLYASPPTPPESALFTVFGKIYATDNHGRDRSDLTRGAGRPTLTRSMLLTWRIVPQWPAHRFHIQIFEAMCPEPTPMRPSWVEDGWMGDCVLVRCDPAQSVSLRLFRELSPIFGDGLMDQAAAWA